MVLAAFVLIAVRPPAHAVTLDEVKGLMASAPLVAGTEKAIGSLEERAVVVTFFASWCPPCRNEFQHLNKLIERVGEDRLTVIGINQFEAWGGKENPARMRKFLTQTKPRFALIKGSEALRVAFGNIERIPSVVVLGAHGREVWRFVHERGATKTHTTTEELISALHAAGVTVASQ